MKATTIATRTAITLVGCAPSPPKRFVKSAKGATEVAVCIANKWQKEAT